MNLTQIPRMIKSKVTQSTKAAKSFKTVIPQAVAELLELQNGDYLEWKHEVTQGGIIFKVKRGTE